MAHLFVSDLHLDAAAPAATDQFIAFLREEAQAAEALYILGDLFEAWIGDDDTDWERTRVCNALRVLSRTVPCFALHGNRDFLLQSGFTARSGVRLLPDPVLVEVGEEPVLLSHGDALCTEDRGYQELRSIVRRPAWQRRFLALDLEERTLLAEEARAGSRAHTTRVVPEIMDVEEQAVRWAFRTSGARFLVHGHTHRPGVHEYEIDGVAVKRIVLGAWYEQGSVLAWGPGGYDLRNLPR